MTTSIEQRPEFFNMVTDFHIKNGQIHHMVPATEIRLCDKVLRARLMLEELGETSIAIHKQDVVEIADGLADLAYVVVGTAVTFGVFCADPKTFVEIEHVDKLEMMRMLCAAVHGVIDRMEDTEETYQLRHLQEAICETLQGIADVATMYFIPLSDVFAEVHRSNMTKKLGGAKEGAKYGEGGGKAETYQPPEIRKVLIAAGTPFA
jgi:predicted HAD superfamily Cof-like phosphohydrolase